MYRVENKSRLISELRKNPRNPRVIKDAGFRKLKASIEQDPQFMVARPIVVSKNAERMDQIIGGNQRFEAVKALGWKEVPVAEVFEATEEEEQRIGLKDNLHAGEHDWDALANDFDIDFLKEVGFDDKELNKIMGKQDHSEDDEFDAEKAAEDIKEPVCKRGDIWQLGKHRIMCGDSTNEEDVKTLMDGKKADMVFTDPPYGMRLDTDWSSAKPDNDISREKGLPGGRKYLPVIGDDKDFDPTFIFDFFACKEIFLWGANYYAELLLGKNDGSWIVWDKRLEESADKMYGSCFELCWSKEKHKQEIARIKWAGVFGTEKEFDHKRHHPTQKPVLLSSWFVEKYSQENWIIVDLFLGSGSTLIACENLGRICYGMEIDPKYCDVIIKRWEEKTGKIAVKLSV